MLYYLITGGTDLKQINSKIKDRRLLKIILKCTAFSPDRRYSNILSVKKALNDLEGIRRFKAHMIASVAVIVLLLSGILLFNRYRDPDPVYEDFIAQESKVLSLDSKSVPMNRAEICRIIVEALGIYDEYAESSFSDVPADSPYYHYISSAVQAKLVQGYEDGSFKPDDPVSAGVYSILVLERALGVYRVSDWSNMDKSLVAAAKTGNNYGIITDEQLEQTIKDPFQPMEVIAEGILVPKAISGAWVEWKSSDKSVATVDSGQVAPVSPGKAVITAEYRRGGDMIVDTCEVIVN